MKTKYIFLTLFILISGFQVCFGQNEPGLEHFGTVLSKSDENNCEYFLSRYDGFLERLYENPGKVGYLVISGGNNPIFNVQYEIAARNNARFRKFDEKRIKFLRSESRATEDIQIEFWIGKNGAKPDLKEKSLDFKLISPDKRLIFVDDSLEVSKFDGKADYVSYSCDVCCFRGFSMSELAGFLEANPDRNAEISVYGKSRARAARLINLLVKDAVLEKLIPRRRLKIRYVGRSETGDGLNKNIFPVKVWLVSTK